MLYVGDIESSLEKDNQLRYEIGYIYDGEEYFYFDCIVKMFNFLNSRGKIIEVFFHNLDFDLLFFLRNKIILEGVEDQNIIQSGNLIISVQIKNVIFRNSLVLLPMPLKKVVQNLLQIEDDDYFDDKNNVTNLTKEELKPYCRKDCLYLHQGISLLSEFVKSNFDQDLKITLPSTAFSIFEKCLNSSSFLEVHNRNNTFFQEGYFFGGHTEKFINGQKVFRNVYYYDVNSLYPDSMDKTEFIEDKKVRVKPSKLHLKKLVRDDILFYCEVTVNIDSENLRFFPSFQDKGGFNAYKFGEQTFKLSEVGIKFILEFGGWENIIEVHTLLVSKNYSTNGEQKTCRPFKEYVRQFFSLRKQNQGFNVIGKLFLNSLYGKFAQKLELLVKIINCTSEEQPVSMSNFEDFLFVSTFKEDAKFYTRYRNRLDIAGKITEYSRLSVARKINKLREYGEVYYTDTDSIITNVNIEETPEISYMVDEEKIGFLSNEIGYKDNVIILGCKMYAFYKSGKTATKGIKKMTLENFREVIRGRQNFENKRFTKLNALIKKDFFGIKIVPFTFRKILERLD